MVLDRVVAWLATKPISIVTLKDPPSNFIAQTLKKISVSEDFWSTRTIDVDNICRGAYHPTKLLILNPVPETQMLLQNM